MVTNPFGTDSPLGDYPADGTFMFKEGRTKTDRSYSILLHYSVLRTEYRYSSTPYIVADFTGKDAFWFDSDESVVPDVGRSNLEGRI
jgi:hypothetical protein